MGSARDIGFKDSYYIALGKIVTYQNVSEHWLISDVARIVGIEETVCQAMLAGTSFDNLLKVLSSVFHTKMHDEDKQRRLKEMVGDLDTLNQQRNRFIHSLWGFAETANFVQTMKHSIKSRKLSTCVEHPKLEDLEQLSSDIAKKFRRLHNFIMETFPQNQ